MDGKVKIIDEISETLEGRRYVTVFIKQLGKENVKIEIENQTLALLLSKLF